MAVFHLGGGETKGEALLITVRSVKGSFGFHKGTANAGDLMAGAHFSVDPISSSVLAPSLQLLRRRTGMEQGEPHMWVSCKLLSNFRVVSRRSCGMFSIFMYLKKNKEIGKSKTTAGSAKACQVVASLNRKVKMRFVEK